MNTLFERELKVVNIGLRSFSETLESRGIPSVHVEWKPPLAADPGAWKEINRNEKAIASANSEAMRRIFGSKPMLAGMGTALTIVPGMHRHLLLHAGPPVTWARMCGPMRGAVLGAIMYEGLAQDDVSAENLAASGTIEFSPCHEHSAVGPMAGIISPSMPVFIIDNPAGGNHAYCTMNEGLGKVLRYGAYDSGVIERLRWMERVLYPSLQAALKFSGPIDLKMIIAQALSMGDEVHNRNRAATSLLYRALAPAIVATGEDKETIRRVLDFINGNDHFFLNLSMAASKVSLDTAAGIPCSSIVVTMARNGTDFGVRLSGTGNAWFTGPSPVPDALFFTGYTKEDANPDIGDSSITETNGLGGFAIASSPAIVQFVGGSAADAVGYTLAMYEITAAENPVYKIPYLDFRGTPTGIDVRSVVSKNILPFIDTGVAHKKPGIGQVGAGVLSAPSEPFVKALEGLAGNLSKVTG